MKLITALLVLTLTACATPEQIAARHRAEAEYAQQQQAAYSQGLRSQCEAIGYRPDTDPWRQCLLQLHTANQQQNAQMRAVILQQYLQQQQQQQYRALPYCYNLPPGVRGYQQAQGTCR